MSRIHAYYKQILIGIQTIIQEASDIEMSEPLPLEDSSQ